MYGRGRDAYPGQVLPGRRLSARPHAFSLIIREKPTEHSVHFRQNFRRGTSGTSRCGRQSCPVQNSPKRGDVPTRNDPENKEGRATGSPGALRRPAKHVQQKRTTPPLFRQRVTQDFDDVPWFAVGEVADLLAARGSRDGDLGLAGRGIDSRH